MHEKLDEIFLNNIFVHDRCIMHVITLRECGVTVESLSFFLFVARDTHPAYTWSRARVTSPSLFSRWKEKRGDTHLALRSNWPLSSFLFSTNGNLLLTTIMLPLEVKLPGSVDHMAMLV